MLPSTFVILYSVFNVLVGGDNRNRTDGLLLARQALSQLSYTPIWCSALASANFKKLVGSNGLEPSTSRLSGARSNHLSYEPIYVAGSLHRPTCCFGFRRWWRRTESNCRPPACKAGALPAELRPHVKGLYPWVSPPF